MYRVTRVSARAYPGPRAVDPPGKQIFPQAVVATPEGESGPAGSGGARWPGGDVAGVRRLVRVGVQAPGEYARGTDADQRGVETRLERLGGEGCQAAGQVRAMGEWSPPCPGRADVTRNC
ncbi:DUF6640 family protein [Streptomyces sp. MW-W600-10]|uniref:DUF6640 family protein n=1 Tax=Streptomyces sp. MW-W600-10 TaxID=2829819 RepID=UPI0035ABC09D